MPTYEYICDQCGSRVEYFQRITEASKTECPECQGSLKKMVTIGAGVIFKGSGFYETDYKKRENGDSKKKSKFSTDKPTEKKSKVKSKSTEPVKE